MEIILLIFDDGFETKVEQASVDYEKLYRLADEYNGEDGAGPYFVQRLELEDFEK